MKRWDDIREALRAHDELEFDIFFEKMRCEQITPKEIVLCVKNDHLLNHIKKTKLSLLEETVEEILGSEVSLVLRSEEERRDEGQGLLFQASKKEGVEESPASFEEIQVVSGENAPGLNPNYTLKSFVVGSSNRFAHAAATAVSEKPAVSSNPLFIYGGVGLGKTHLLHAIGNAILARRPSARIALRSSEEFTNELIASLQSDGMPAFKERYRRECDVLLIDDIQFIAGKTSTQEEFFHTFNTLYNNMKQIVLISDKTPKEIPGLEERLRSRFQWGLMADIQRPEMEMRTAILMKKAEEKGISLPSEVALYIANHVDTNVRDLEGILKQVAARAQLLGASPTLDLARLIIDPYLKEREVKISPERIIKLVANYFDIKVSDIHGRGRSKQIALPRQIAMFLARKHTQLSFPELGRRFKKDHSTVINAVKKLEKLVPNDLSIKSTIAELERSLLS